MKILQHSIVICLLSFAVSSFGQMDQDKTKIKIAIQTMADAWGEADGDKFASVFTDNHDFIVWNGFYFKEINKEMNAQNHDYIFETLYKNTDMHFAIDKIKFIKDDVALVHVYGAVSKKGEARPKDPTVLYTALLVKTEGDWLITSFHNLDLEVFENEKLKAAMPIPADIMYSGWYSSKKS